jgi:uncharacterized protein (TIGR03382 family)
MIMKLLRFSLSRTLLLAAASAPSSAFALGGPDAWGYTWASSDDSGGPAYEWIDIESVGSLVAGLGNDNASAPTDLMMEFPYYWGRHTSVIVGSNGWIGFERVGNLAGCLPAIPTAGGFDNYIAPFMTDLTLAGEGNPGRVLTYRANSPDRFVVSYIDVPYFANNDAGFVGSNTFQVVLGADGTITFNYKTTDPGNFPNSFECGTDLEIGIENITGNIGLEVYNEAVPASESSIRFTPPETVSLSLADAIPEFWSSPDPGGRFIALGSVESVRYDVSNVGNTGFANPISGTSQVLDASRTAVATFPWSVPPLASLDFYGDTAGEVLLDSIGTYTVSNTLASAEDINPSNNRNEIEWRVIDTDAGPVRLTYADSGELEGIVATELAPGTAFVYVAPPRDGGSVVAIDAFVVETTAEPAGSYSVALYAPDPSTGQPGVRLETPISASSALPDDGWTRFELGVDYPLTLEGVWVAFESDSRDYAIGVDSTGPFSRRAWEETSGAAPYRSMHAGDFMLGVVAEFTPDDIGDDVGGPDDVGGGDVGDPDAGGDDVGTTDAGGDDVRNDADEPDGVDDTALPPDSDNADGSGESDVLSPADDVEGSDATGGGGGSSGGCAAAPHTPTAPPAVASLIAAALVLTRRRRRD